MNASVVTRIQELLDEVHVGIMASIDGSGTPCLRWMTPVFVPRLKGALYAVTSRDSRKARQIENNPRVTWMIQSKSLDRVATLSGQARLVKDPSLSAEVLEAIGPRLEVLWTYMGDPKKLMVLETTIESASWMKPLTASSREEF